MTTQEKQEFDRRIKWINVCEKLDKLNWFDDIFFPKKRDILEAEKIRMFNESADFVFGKNSARANSHKLSMDNRKLSGLSLVGKIKMIIRRLKKEKYLKQL